MSGVVCVCGMLTYVCACMLIFVHCADPLQKSSDRPDRAHDERGGEAIRIHAPHVASDSLPVMPTPQQVRALIGACVCVCVWLCMRERSIVLAGQSAKCATRQTQAVCDY